MIIAALLKSEILHNSKAIYNISFFQNGKGKALQCVHTVVIELVIVM